MNIIILILLFTLIHTEQGLKPIEEIRVGDKVLSLDERTGETSYQPVMEHQGPYQLVKVTLENGEQLEATAGHPFYIQGWISSPTREKYGIPEHYVQNKYRNANYGEEIGGML